MTQDSKYLSRALELAKQAGADGEIPVGAVIVRDGRIIAEACNRREADGDATAHAEILAIRSACRALGGWRLPDCTLYVTLEPCPMCAGAILAARIDRVVYALKDPAAGAMGSLMRMDTLPLGHRVECRCGELADEVSSLMRAFFAERRGKER